MTKFQTARRYCPLPCMILIGLVPLVGILHLVARTSIAFSDFLSDYVSPFPRFLLASITNFLPFSLAETILMASPIIIILVTVIAVKLNKKELFHSVRMISILLSIIAVAYIIFALGFAPGYSGSTLEAKMELDRKPVSALELKETALILRERCEELLDDVTFLYGSSSVMPYSLDEMNEKLNNAYRAVAEKYGFVKHFPSRVKYVVLSVPMSYTHITGVYSFFTGEANINIHFPDYTIPYTAAHELSHQRGIAREDEANFMAFLVCAESEDPYIRYCGSMNLFEYVFSALSRADKTAYKEIWNQLDGRMRSEIVAYQEFFDQYRDNVVANVSGAINNGYLQSQGQTEGTKSYGRVVDLAVAYLLYEEADELSSEQN